MGKAGPDGQVTCVNHCQAGVPGHCCWLGQPAGRKKMSAVPDSWSSTVRTMTSAGQDFGHHRSQAQPRGHPWSHSAAQSHGDLLLTHWPVAGCRSWVCHRHQNRQRVSQSGSAAAVHALFPVLALLDRGHDGPRQVVIAHRRGFPRPGTQHRAEAAGWGPRWI